MRLERGQNQKSKQKNFSHLLWRHGRRRQRLHRLSRCCRRVSRLCRSRQRRQRRRRRQRRQRRQRRRRRIQIFSRDKDGAVISLLWQFFLKSCI